MAGGLTPGWIAGLGKSVRERQRTHIKSVELVV